MTNTEPSPSASLESYMISRRAQFFTAVAVLLAFAVLIAIAAPGAGAVSDEEELAQFGSLGEAAGQLREPRGIATDPITGHVYVADTANNRISEFTPWGNFVKAFGWDVAPGAVNETQEVRVRAAEGQFRLAFKGKETPDLAFDAPGSESEGPGSVEAALNALTTIGGAGANVSVSAVPGTTDGIAPYVYAIVFKGSLAAKDVEQISIAKGTTEAKGGKPSTMLEARTRADGTPGGTGLESCTEESGCRKGFAGGGAGEINFGSGGGGIATDASGNLYVREPANGGNDRVQKFDPSGRFLLTLGGEVNKTKVEALALEAERNLCPVDPGDVCQAGAQGSGQGQFGTGNSSGIAFGPAGKLFVGDVERIQRFSAEGQYEASVPVAGKTVHDLVVAPGSGDFYATAGPPGGTEENVRKLDSTTGAEVSKLEGSGETKTIKATAGPIATDPIGDVFARRNNVTLSPVLQFDPEGKQTSEFGTAETGFRIEALGTNAAGDLYAAYRGASDNYIRSFGPGPVSFEAAPKVPPTITAQFASSVGRNDATVAAEINPHFWSDTRYYVQYGTGKCSEGGCEEAKPIPPGAILSSKVTSTPLRGAGITLEGLKAGTTYHYRFIAESGGGGPVSGNEHTFITYPAAAPLKTDCPNQAFRTGFSAPLTSCRAYEMVSPVDKNNGDIRTLFDTPALTLTNVSQSAVNGSRFTYSSYRSFADPKGAPYANQYLATRKDGVGWTSESLNAAQGSNLDGNVTFENTFKAFSADLCRSWMVAEAKPVLAPGASEGFELYRRDNCGEEGYEALIKAKSFFPFPILQGTSTDGRVAIFSDPINLTPDAASGGVWQAYYASNGELHLLCIGTNGLPSTGNCSAGTGPNDQSRPAGVSYSERLGSLSHAVSGDGSKVYWTDSGGNKSGPGKVYLRLNPDQPQSELSAGECTEAEKACTVRVSETVTNKASRFLGASTDGSRALFEVTEGTFAGKLYEFELGAGAREIAGKVDGVAGASEDLSRVYFASEEVLPETSGATAGEPNLYLDQEGMKTFIATLSNGDRETITPEPIYHAARATPDGRVLAFVSTGSPTGYDNISLGTGKPALEVYLYEAGAPGPVCISCNPSRSRPLGRSEEPLHERSLAPGSSLTLPENDLYSPHAISRDGRRLFFNSYDALLLRDTNGKADVYEWQSAQSQKECEEQGADLYVASATGCLSLISSGQSPSDSEFLDASENGEDAFFTTNASLLPQDPGLIDVYDARVNGGLPAPPAPPGPCQGEACQFAPAPPNDPTPASASFKGAGNPVSTRCAKSKVARKGRCVAKKRRHAKKKHKRRKAANNRRQGR